MNWSHILASIGASAVIVGLAEWVFKTWFSSRLDRRAQEIQHALDDRLAKSSTLFDRLATLRVDAAASLHQQIVSTYSCIQRQTTFIAYGKRDRRKEAETTEEQAGRLHNFWLERKIFFNHNACDSLDPFILDLVKLGRESVFQFTKSAHDDGSLPSDVEDKYSEYNLTVTRLVDRYWEGIYPIIRSAIENPSEPLPK